MFGLLAVTSVKLTFNPSQPLFVLTLKSGINEAPTLIKSVTTKVSIQLPSFAQRVTVNVPELKVCEGFSKFEVVPSPKSHT